MRRVKRRTSSIHRFVGPGCHAIGHFTSPRKTAKRRKSSLKWKGSYIRKHKKNPADYYYAFMPVGPKKPVFVSRDGQKWRALAGQSKKLLLRGFRKHKIKYTFRSSYLDGTPTKGRLYKFLIIDTQGPMEKKKK